MRADFISKVSWSITTSATPMPSGMISPSNDLSASAFKGDVNR